MTEYSTKFSNKNVKHSLHLNYSILSRKCNSYSTDFKDSTIFIFFNLGINNNKTTKTNSNVTIKEYRKCKKDSPVGKHCPGLEIWSITK